MLQKPQDCLNCPLHSLGHGFSKPEGTGVNGVLIMGEALGDNERKDGLPFRPYAPAGHVLEQAFKSLGMDRQQFCLFNAGVNCQPPRNELLGAPYEYAAIEHCKVHVRRVIAQYRPRVIVACGAIPTRVLTGLTGKKMRIEDLQGFPIEACDYPGIWVIPTYHPSYIQRGAWQVFPVLRLAIAKAVKIAKDGWHPPQFQCLQNASPQDVHDMADELEANPAMDLNFDFETDGGEIEPDAIETDEEDEEESTDKKGAITTRQLITQVNLSIRDNEALAIDFNANTRHSIERILATANEKHGHNAWMFDLPVAEHNGITINGRVADSMWKFHHAYPDLPGSYKKVAGDTAKDQGSLASLQFCASFYGFPFPWKHLRLEEGHLYGCYDAIAGRMVNNGATRDLLQLRVLDGYEMFVQRLRPILADAERRGIPLNIEKLKAFIAMLQKREAEELQKLAPMIPQELCPPKQKTGLKKEPKDTVGKVKRTFFLLEPEKCSCVKTTREKKCSTCKGTGSTFDENDEVVDCVTCKGAGVSSAVTTTMEGCPACGGTGEVKGDVERWCDLLPFNPNSPAQVKLYTRFEGMTPQGHKKAYAIPKNSKRKYAMDKETLERLAKMHKDPVYETILTAKGITKIRGTYGEGWLMRMNPQTQCVHTQFLFLPATGQLSSTAPNVQNGISPHKLPEGHPMKPLAFAWADSIEAKPGYVWIALDYKSFHAQTFAWEAKDWDYLRLAKLDIHSYIVGQMLRLEGYKQALGWDDEKLRAWLIGIKKKHSLVREKQAKPAAHGFNFGLQAPRLYRANLESFRNMQEAQAIFDALTSSFPIAARYRVDAPELAFRQKYLRSVFGCIRWFWNVKTYDFKHREWAHGQDHDKATAFRPANNAFCHKKIAMHSCEEQGYLEKYGLANDLHDALWFHCEKSLADACMYNAKTEMEKESTVMTLPDGKGLDVQVDVKMGPTWARMTEVKV